MKTEQTNKDLKEETPVELQDQEQSSETVSQDAGDQELVACHRELEQWKDRFTRVSADLENIRKRALQDQQAMIARSQSKIFSDLVGVVDNFDRALDDDSVSFDVSQQQWVDGIALIRKELLNLLSVHGVEEITETEVFDPELHEALVQVDSDMHESGQIVEVLQKGYRLHGKMMRPSKVSVSK